MNNRIYTGELTDEQCNELINQYMRESDIIKWNELDQDIKDKLCQKKWEEEQLYQQWCQRDWHE